MASNKNTGAATDQAAGAVTEPAPPEPAAESKAKRKAVKIEWPPGLEDGQVLPIEDLCEKLEVKRSLFAGVCAANRWRPGKQLSVKEFKAAVEAFSGGAVGRSEKRCSGT